MVEAIRNTEPVYQFQHFHRFLEAFTRSLVKLSDRKQNVQISVLAASFTFSFASELFLR